MTDQSTDDTSWLGSEPEHLDRRLFRQIRISVGSLRLEILLHPDPDEPEGQATIAELFDGQGTLQLHKVAHISLHSPFGVVHTINDPAERASLLTRLNPIIPAPNQSLRASDGTSPLNAFPDGQGSVPTNPAVLTTINAIWKGGDRARELIDGWTSRDDGQPVYEHASVNGGRITVYIQPSRSRDLATASTLWALVEQLSPFTADVALAVLAQLCAPEIGYRPQYPLLEPVRITADAILGYKGIQRWGAERTELRQRVATEIENLRHLSFDVEAWPVQGAAEQGRDHASWRGDTLFDIVTVERGTENQSTSISWSVRAGQWAYWWLNASGRVFIGRMARALLELDHRQNRGAILLAKKIGQSVLLRVGGTQQHQLTLPVASLLTDIGELPIERARTKDWAGRTRDRLDDALLSLIESGLFINVSWPDGYGPTDDDRQRGWVELWLVARVVIVVATPQAPAELSPPPEDWRAVTLPELAPTEEAVINGQAIRRARAARQWKQEQLARHLGISVPYLSQIEGDRRQPSPQLAARLRTWIAESSADDS